MNAPVLNAPRTLRLNAADNVIVAVDPWMSAASPRASPPRARVLRGHKMATRRSPRASRS